MVFFLKQNLLCCWNELLVYLFFSPSGPQCIPKHCPDWLHSILYEVPLRWGCHLGKWDFSFFLSFFGKCWACFQHQDEPFCKIPKKSRNFSTIREELDGKVSISTVNYCYWDSQWRYTAVWQEQPTTFNSNDLIFLFFAPFFTGCLHCTSQLISNSATARVEIPSEVKRKCRFWF